MGCSGSKLRAGGGGAVRGRTDLLAMRPPPLRPRRRPQRYAFSPPLRRLLLPPLHRLRRQPRGLAPLPPPPLPPSSASSAKGRSFASAAAAAAAAAAFEVALRLWSHIQFHSSDDEEDGGSGADDPDSQLHSGNLSPDRYHFHQEHETWVPTSVNFNYARDQPQPSTVHFANVGGRQRRRSFILCFPSGRHILIIATTLTLILTHIPPTITMVFWEFFGLSPPNLAPPPAFGSAADSSAPSTSKPPPPPPSPPRVSTWDFLDPFGAQETYYPSYPPSRASRSSREVRDEEGIPDLEEEDDDVDEVVKEVYGEQKFVGSTTREYNGNEDRIGGVGENSRSVEVENEENVVEKKVVADDSQQQNVAASSSKPRKYSDISEIGSEIRVQFDRASDAATELSKMLEVGKHPYRFRKSSVIEVSSRMMCVMPPSTSNGEDFLNFEEDIVSSSKNLSSILQKLYIWEKKLQDEVKAEEKMRLLHERNSKRLRHLAERGAEAQKLEEVQNLIRKLSTKIRIRIQVVDSISNKINKLRDEELWPQIDELIQGSLRMWKNKLECHRIQCQAISKAKGLDSIANGGKLDDVQLRAMMDLELEVLRLTGNFASWISSQKNYVRALNGWLVLCLHYEPEVTADGVPPYSPGRIGAPPVFVICNSWSQAVDRISEMEVINAMKAFAARLRHLWEQNSVDPKQRMMPNGDMERSIRAREREVQIVNKEVDALNKKLALVSGQSELPNYSSEENSQQLGLKQIFEALENFAANSFKAYEELHIRSEEEKVAWENTKLSG
ncbi:uncharacterized protein A4U43_C04F24040 [Asparagus officinalis]|uniref:DUF632 domain-containing protein n=1 Tax=Asparagus officinalis TaxID=4686 RepID=A0A5P1F3V7_ASPOF|nr:uncharacterized protein LOC109837825 isoform X1 [Asparagus officinalis]XP_020261781.1 uncharacterized protein LOC109837825 isoform X2 [Asparagus officinalis]XP_020261782.1 uncharacterized protein LOC109837825 isoform X1 [Asparagus officinalis]ONK72852.1 uncharacterized protein A4U43_C04F24040 [Asparagus officinalis]